MVKKLIKHFNGSFSSLLTDLKFLLLFGSIVFAYAGFYFTTQSELRNNTKEITVLSQELSRYEASTKTHIEHDIAARENIKKDIQTKYSERMIFQQDILKSLGMIQGKLDQMLQDDKR